MTAKQKVTAVVHDLDETGICGKYPDGSSSGAVRPGNSGARDVVSGCNPKNHETQLRLAIAATGGFSQVSIDDTNASGGVMSGCDATALKASFETNYANGACSRWFTMDFYRASANGEGVASTVSASGRIAAKALVNVYYPVACRNRLIQDLDAILGNRASIDCNLTREEQLGADMSISPTPLPLVNYTLGWAGINFTVRVVFEEDVANSYAHDSLLSACGTSPKAPSLSGSLCTLRPVISTSATGKR